MAQKPQALRALVCEDDAGLGRALATLAHFYGFGEVTLACSGAEALSLAVITNPHVVVVDLAVTGTLGLRIVGLMRTLAPMCSVIAVAPFPALRRAARQAGAVDLLAPSDLRPLGAWLNGIRQAAHVGAACECCSQASTVSGSGAQEFSIDPLSPLGISTERGGSASSSTQPQRGPSPGSPTP